MRLYIVTSKMDDGVGWENMTKPLPKEEAEDFKSKLIAEGYDGTLTVVPA